MAKSHQVSTIKTVRVALKAKSIVKKVFIAKRTAKLACRAKKRLRAQ